MLTHAPGNGAPIDGVKVEAASAWFAARPSGTEDVYKIYAESFRGADHLRLVLEEAQTIVDDAGGAGAGRGSFGGGAPRATQRKRAAGSGPSLMRLRRD